MYGVDFVYVWPLLNKDYYIYIFLSSLCIFFFSFFYTNTDCQNTDLLANTVPILNNWCWFIHNKEPFFFSTQDKRGTGQSGLHRPKCRHTDG